MNIYVSSANFYRFFYFILVLNATVYGQTIAPQTLVFGKICAGKFNQFDATFNHSGFPASTPFEVQLSDHLGNFSVPVATTTLSITDISASQKTITFAVPTNLIGSDNYKLRVKSSTGIISSNFYIKNPNNTGTLSYFTAYYKPFEDVYYINNKQSNAYLCSGGSITLSIDNPTPEIQSSSPANYSNIKYKWYKGTTIISGQTGSSLVVNSPGNYYVTLDYASCTDSNSRSNSVTVSETTGGTTGAISSSLGNPFCPAGNNTILSAVVGNSYQWYKDNVKINDATSPNYSTNQPGLYAVTIDFGGCKNTFDINLKVNEIESTLNIPETSLINEGETKNVVVTTNAINPTFEWYLNNTLISVNTNNTLTITTPGSYKVAVTQNSGCSIKNEIAFELNSAIDASVVSIPNLISPNNDGVNDTWIIPQEYSVGSNTEVVVMDSNGKIVFKSDNYLNNWPENPIVFENINPVYYYLITPQNGKAKKGSITLVK
nr:gliding motility-associated C-terminal domain-containing protein [uncultured Flavobacterium sp.]